MASTTRTGEEGLARAWGWVAALRGGSSVPWTAWTAPAEAQGRHLPGAQQLELLRRVNAAAGGVPSRAGLAERVLQASAPGRGRPDLQLDGATSAQAARFGPAPVDPGALSDAELVRVASGLVADDLVVLGPPPTVQTRRPSVRSMARPVEVGGDAWVAPFVREALAARGRGPGGPRSTAWVVGGGLHTMLAHAWTARALDEGGGPWREWVRGFVRTKRTPPRGDLAGHAAFWAARVGRRRVHVVTEPGLLPGLLGERRLPAPPRLTPDAVELARRVGGPLGLLVTSQQRHALLSGPLAVRLDAGPEAPVPPPALPARWHRWHAERAERVHGAVLRAGYPVHGDPDALLAPPLPGVDPYDDGVLALAVDLLLRPAEPGDDDRDEGGGGRG